MNLTVEKRFLSLFLALVMVFSLFPWWTVKVNAKVNDTVTVEGLTVLQTEMGNTGAFTFEGDTLTVYEKSTSSSGCGSTSYTQRTTKVSLTNGTGMDLKLTFNGSLSNGGSATIGGDAFGTGMTKDLANGDSLEISVTSHKSNTNQTTLTLTIVREESAKVTTTFAVAENGSYTVDGTAITAETLLQNSAAKEYALVATPVSGYQFIGWYSTAANGYVSYEATANLQFAADTTVYPVFISDTIAMFSVVGTKIQSNDLTFVANEAAKTSSKTVVLTNDGILEGEHTIPKGVTLLIPFDSAYTQYGDDPGCVKDESSSSNPYASPKPFRTLTMADGAQIKVEGNIEVSAKHYVSHGGKHVGGRPVEYYGYIVMQGNSKIELYSGANLYAWGYISGSSQAQVIAKSGSTIYEKMQVADYRGGSATSDLTKDGHFPFSQYYIQNVEVKETIEYGAQLICHAAIWSLLTYTDQTVNFMGSGSMFTLKPGSQATKYYDVTTDRLIVDVEGEFSFNSISLMGYDTEDFVLPMQQNLTINLKSGAKATIDQDIMLQPGCIINIEQGATLTLTSGKKAYLMDASDWGTYSFSAKLWPITYVPTKGAAPGIRTASNMTDAKVNVNGTLIVNGAIFATANHASVVTTDKTGVIQFNADVVENTSIKQCTTNAESGFKDVQMYPVLLTSGDGTTVNVSGSTADTKFYYCNKDNADHGWHKGEVCPKCCDHAYDNDCDTECNNGCGTTREPKHTPGPAATCTSAQTCTVCEAVLAEALPHNYTFDCDKNCSVCGQETRPEAVCVSDAAHPCIAGKCKYCGKDIAAIAHTPGEAVKENVVAATCTTAGSYESVVYCTVCKTELSRQTVTVDALGHTPGEAVKENEVAATCTTAGSYESVVYCTVCKTELSRKSETVPVIPHDYKIAYTWENGTDAKACIATRTCSGCSEGDTARVVASGEETTAPTCTESGVRTYTATFSETWAETQTTTESIDPLGHTPGEAATCTTAQLCTVCEAELKAALGHDYDETKSEENLTRPVKNGDTWSDGYYTFTCKNDPTHTKTETVKRADYSAYETAKSNLSALLDLDLTDEAKAAINAALEANKLADNLIETEQSIVDGATSNLNAAFEQYKDKLKTYTVTFVIDGVETKVEVVSGKGATAPANPAKPYDATNHYEFSGWDNAFDKVTSDITVTAEFNPIAHTFSSTDKNDDVHTDKCACGYEKDVDHSYVLINTVNGTCVAGKVESYECSICHGTKDVIGEKDPKNHAALSTVPQTDATCDSVGYEEGGYCSACDTWTWGHEEIPAINHKNKVHHDKVDATCISTGTIEYWSCPDCGKNFSDEACTKVETDLTIKIDPNNHAKTGFVYDIHENNTHTKKNACCKAEIETVEHTYVDGKCECNDIEKVTVTWKDSEGNVIATETVEYGNTATTTEKAPEIFGYTSTLDTTVENVTEDTVVEVVLTPKTFEIVWKVDDSTYETTTIKYSDNVATVVPPEKEGYNFIGWFDANGNQITDATKYLQDNLAISASIQSRSGSEQTEIAGYTVLEAKYEIKTYTITWIVDGVTTTETYKHFETPSFKGSTDKAYDDNNHYFFDGWDKEIAEVSGEATYTAVYAEKAHFDSLTDNDHVCDLGCGKEMNECVDGDFDHDCDNGCDKYFGIHTDTDGENDHDHLCDYCGGAVDGEVCNGGEATCTESAVCIECGKPYGDPNGHSFIGSGTECSACDFSRFAYIGDESYATLEEAFAAAKEGDTIVVLKKIVIEGEVTWDLSGKTLDVRYLDLENYSIVVNGNLTVNGGNYIFQNLFGIGVPQNGKLTVNDGKFTTPKDYYLIGSWGDTTINGGEFEAVYCNVNGFEGTLNINGGKFTVSDKEYGSDVFAGDGVANITGGDYSTDISYWCAEGHTMDTDGNGRYPYEKHSYESVPTPPTCTEKGYTTNTCACGDSYVDGYKDATGHIRTHTINAKEATLNDEGYTGDKFCDDCKTIVEYGEAIPVKTGAEAEVNGIKYATLAEAMAAAVDTDYVVILLKDVTMVEKLTVEGKQTWSFGEHTLTIASAQDNYGMIVKGQLTIEGGNFDVSGMFGIGVTGTLTVNGGNFTVKGNNDYLIGNWGKTVINGGSFSGQYCCVNNFSGTTTINGGAFSTAAYDATGEYESCDLFADSGLTVNGGTFSKDVTEYCPMGYHTADADGDGVYTYGAHRYGGLKINTFCLTDGYIVISCPDCGNSYDSREDEDAKQYLIDNPYFNLAPLGHDYVDHDAKEPTCTDIGWAAYQTCSRCDYTTYSELPAKGHKSSKVEVVKATCEEYGYLLVTCNGCGETFDSREEGFAKDYLEEMSWIYKLDPIGHAYDDDFDAICNNDEAHVRVAKTLIAMVGDVKYESFTDAVAAAKDGDTVVLYSDVTLTEKLVIKTNQKWSFGDYTVTVADCGYDYGIVISGELTVESGNFIVNGYYGIGVGTSGKLTVNDGSFSVAGDNDYLIGNWGKTVINGGSFSGQYCCVNNFSGTATINGGAFSTAAYDATGEYESCDLFADSGLTVNGGIFSKDVTEYCAMGYHTALKGGVYEYGKHRYSTVQTYTFCEENGYVLITCGDCGNIYDSREDEEAKQYLIDNPYFNLTPKGHKWNETSYDWSADGKTCTATRVCENDSTHIETATATITSAVEKAPTCTKMGDTKYTASFESDFATVQTKTVTDIAETGHDWDETSYDWSADGKTCTATRVCKNDSEHVETADAKITSVVSKDATCTEKGDTTYTAKFDVAFATTQTVIITDVEPIGHDWNKATYVWGADGNTCTATRVCKNDAEHTETANADITSAVSKAATCAAKGDTTYTATFTESWASVQTKTLTDIPAIGHDWKVSYEWSADGKSCVAVRLCQNNANHKETSTATIKSEQTKAPTCTDMGDTTYTASFNAEWADEQTKIVTNVPATDHAWSVSYKWTKVEGGWTCTATHTCANSVDCTETETVTATGAVKTSATCTVAGWTTYTADFTAAWAADQTKDVQDIPATDHAWSVSYEWTQVEGEWTCTATHTCANSTACTETETVTAIGTVKTPATCTEVGTTTYTATFAADWAEVQTQEENDIPALNHSWSVSYEWTKVEGGWTCTATHTCANSTACTETETVTATGTVKTPATCTEVGTTAYTATFKATWAEVQTKEENDIPATGHNEVTDNAKAPTCTETGLTEGSHCDKCGTVFVAQETVDELGHTEGAAVTENLKEATCVASGSYDQVVYCTVCNAELSRESFDVNPTEIHKYVVEYRWSGTRYCAAIITCETCDLNNTVQGKLTSEYIEGDCQTYSKTVYTVTFSEAQLEKYEFLETQVKEVLGSKGDHSYSYFANADEHWGVCTVCESESAKTAHDFSAGDCMCGEGKPITAIPVGINKYDAATDSGYTVRENVVTIKYSEACAVGYLADGKYVAIEAVMNDDGRYSFTAPEGVDEVLVVVIGDIDGDGDVDEADIDLMAGSQMPEGNPLTAEQHFAADINRNGAVNSADRVLLARSLLEKTNDFYKALSW